MDLGTVATLVTTVAVLIGVVFGLLELRQANRQRRDQAAVEIVRSVTEESILTAVYKILELPDDADPELINGNPQLLNAANHIHFATEMYGSLVFEGVVDLHMLDRMNGSWIRACFERLRKWIESERVAEKRVNVGEWWQWLYERMIADPEPSKAVGAHVYYKGKTGP